MTHICDQIKVMDQLPLKETTKRQTSSFMLMNYFPGLSHAQRLLPLCKMDEKQGSLNALHNSRQEPVVVR